MTRRSHIFTVGLAALLALATPRAFGEEIREVFTPTRANGMGGAYTAIANDDNAVWTNPAGIARLRKARSRKPISLATFPNMSAGTNSGTAPSFYFGLTSEDAIAETITEAELTGEKPLWAMLSTAPMVFFDVGGAPTGIGAYTQTTLKVVPNDQTGESKVDSLTDFGGVLSFAITNSSNRFSIGAQMRYVNRYALESSVPTSNLTDSSALKDQFAGRANTTSGMAVDAGMIFTLADFWFPTLGVSVLNAPLGCQENYLNPFAKERQTVCGTKFTGSVANDEALTLIDPTDVRVGMSIAPRLSRTIGMRVAVDVQNLAFGSGDTYIGQPGIPIMKMLHAGAELFYGNPLVPNPFSLRLGASQGFVSYGATARLGALALEMAVYGRDISTDDTPKEDRRILGSLSLEF